MVKVTKPKCRIRLLNTPTCAVLEDRWYVDGVEQESLSSERFFGAGFQDTTGWTTSNATIRSDGNSATITKTIDAEAYVTLDFQNERVLNPGFETGNWNNWSHGVASQGEQYVYTTDKHSGSYGCHLSAVWGAPEFGGWIKQSFATKEFYPSLSPAPTFWMKSGYADKEAAWGMKVTLHYADGSEYSETFDPVASWTQKTLTSASVKTTKLLQWIQFETWDALEMGDPHKGFCLHIDDISFVPYGIIDTHDAPYLSINVVGGSIATGETCTILVRDTSGVPETEWHTVATINPSDISTTPVLLRYNAHDDGYDGEIEAIRIKLSHLNDWIRINYIMLRHLVDWVWDAGVSSETGGWLSSDLDEFEFHGVATDDGISMVRTISASRSETPYLTVRYKAGTDVSLKFDAYIDSAWSNDIFSDTPASHTDDWEYHQYKFTSGTSITKLRVRAKASSAHADAFIDFIAIHSSSDDCRVFDDEYIKDLNIDKREDRADTFSLVLANPNGYFKNLFKEGSRITIELCYEGQSFTKVFDGSVQERKQSLAANDESIDVSGEATGSFLRYNNITVNYYETDYGSIISDILSIYGVDYDNRRRVFPSTQFAHKTFQYGTVYYEETGVLEILKSIAEKCGYEFYIDDKNRVHFFFNEVVPYVRPEEYSENSITYVWTGSLATVTDETTTVYLGNHAVKVAALPTYTEYSAWVKGKWELCSTLNRITFFAQASATPCSLKLELYDSADTKISESSTFNFTAASAWERVTLEVTSGDQSQLMNKIKIIITNSSTNQYVYFDAFFAGGVLPRERKFPFPYDGDRFTEGNSSEWSATGGTVSDSPLSKVGKYSIKTTDTSTHFTIPLRAMKMRVYAPDIYNYFSFWFKGTPYGTPPSGLVVRLYSRTASLTDFAYKTVSVTDSWGDWHYCELKLGSGQGWTIQGTMDWTCVHSIQFLPSSYNLDELYIDGIRFFYDGSPTTAIQLGGDIISLEAKKDVNQVVNRVTVTYDQDYEFTIEDTQSQSLYDLREKSYRKPLYSESEAVAFAYATILEQAFPRDTAKIRSVGTTAYTVGQFISFNVSRLDLYKRGVISQVKHDFSSSGWTTEIGVGSPQLEQVFRHFNDEINELKRVVALSGLSQSWSDTLAISAESVDSPIISTGEALNFTDTSTQIYLSSSNLCFKDPTTGTKTLAQLAAGSAQSLSDTLAIGNLSGYNSIKMVYGYKIYGYTASETGSPTYTIDAETGTFTSADGDLPSIFGRTKLSTNDATDAATVMHRDMTESTGYALKQTAGGATAINCVSGQTVSLDVNNALKVSLTTESATFYVAPLVYNGYFITLYSDAGTTQKAKIDGATGNTDIEGTLTMGASSSVILDASTASTLIVSPGGSADGSLAVKPASGYAQSAVTARNANSGTNYGGVSLRVVYDDPSYYGEIAPIVAGSGTKPNAFHLDDASWDNIYIGDASCNAYIGGALTISGNDIKDSGGNTVLSFNGTGGVDKIGGDTPASGEALTWDGSKAVWTGVLTNPTSADVKWYSGVDAIFYSDAGTTEKARIDGATGNITTQGGTIATYSSADFRMYYDTGSTKVLEIDGATGTTSLYYSADLVVYSDGGSTEKARIDGATGNITTVGTVDGIDVSSLPSGAGTQNSITKWTGTNSIGAATNFTQDATNNYIYMASGSGSYYSLYVGGGGEVTLTANTGYAIFGAPTSYHVAISQQHIQAKASGTTTTTLAIQPRGGTTQLGFYTKSDLELYNAGDIIVFSDGGTTEKARIDGATGNITTVGTVDGADVGSLNTAYYAHDHSASDPTQVSYTNLADVPTTIVKTNQANTYDQGSKQTFRPSATTAGINIGGASGDPSSPQDGDMWYDTASSRLQFRYSTTTGAFVDEAKSQTITNKTINATDNTITDTSTAAGDLLSSNGTKFIRFAKGTSGFVLQSTDVGIQWTAAPTGSGTQYSIPRWATTTQLGSSLSMTEDNTNKYVTINAASAGQFVLNLLGGTAATLTANTGYDVIGAASGAHVAIDTNGIQAKGSGTTSAALDLQEYGGDVRIGYATISGLMLYRGTDLNIYSDAGSTIKFFVDGGTGDISATGLVKVYSPYTLTVTPTAASQSPILRLLPGTGNTASYFELLNTSDTANYGAARLELSGTTLSLTSTATGTGTAPTTLNINDTDYATINIGGSAAAVNFGGDIQVGGNDIKDSGGNIVVSFDGTGGVDKIGGDTPASGEALTWDGSKAVWSGIVANPTTVNISWHSGVDAIFYSDAGTTEKARIDGATGNFTTAGTVTFATDLYTSDTGGIMRHTPSVSNKDLFLKLFPSGTGTLTEIDLANSSSTTNYGALRISCTTGSVDFQAGLWGSGTRPTTLNMSNLWTTINIGDASCTDNLISSSHYVFTNTAATLYKDTRLYSAADLIVYSDAGSTEKARIDGATGNITTAGTIQVSGNDVKDSGGNVVLSFNGTGGVDKIGDDTPSTNDFLQWDGSKVIWTAGGGGGGESLNATLAIGNTATGYNILMYNGYDILWYSDAGTTVKAAVYGDTGRASIGRAIGSVGIPTLEVYGTASGTSCASIQEVISTDNYPTYQMMSYEHDNIIQSFDCYYDGSYRSSDAGSNYQIYKSSDILSVRGKTGVSAGTAISTWDAMWEWTATALTFYQDLRGYSGKDIIIYSDAGTTEKARIDGATGNITTEGNITGQGATTVIKGGNASGEDLYLQAYDDIFIAPHNQTTDYLIIDHDGSGNVQMYPDTTGTCRLGKSGTMFYEMYASYFNTGDIIFQNAFRIAEERDISAGASLVGAERREVPNALKVRVGNKVPAIVFTNQRDEEIARLDEDGNLHIAGKIFTEEGLKRKVPRYNDGDLEFVNH